MHNYQDHFSEQAASYLNYRPNYPEALYEYLASLLNSLDVVWDVGTGNGQAALQLAKFFKRVIASDRSQSQLDVAVKAANIEYHCWPADHTKLEDHSVDLTTVAQAVHWFNLDQFYAEVRRVTKPNGLIAVWGYSLGTLDVNVNELIKKLYSEILGSNYWPKERRYLDEEYKSLPFPFKKKLTPKFLIERQFNLDDLLGYLNTWTAVKEYELRNNDSNPIDLIEADLRAAWGDPQKKYRMSWPVHLLVGSMAE